MNKTALNKSSYVPLYRQLVEKLAEQIRSGEFQPGERLPSEREMAENLNVSRTTARLAIEELVASSLVYRDQGRGTFVAAPTTHSLMGFASFTEELIARGYRPGSHIIEQALVAADAKTCTDLNLEAGEQVVHLVRLRLADDKPVAIQYEYLPARLVPGLESRRLTDRSLHQILREDYYVYPAWIEAEIAAVRAEAEHARYLEIGLDDPVLAVHGRTFTESFEVVETVQTFYRGDQLTLHFGRQRVPRVKA